MTFSECLPAIRASHPRLAEEIISLRGLSDLLDWFQRTGRAHSPVDIIALDEFEYDFLIQLQPEREWLAFGIT